jgi:hypothetical protein
MYNPEVYAEINFVAPPFDQAVDEDPVEQHVAN